MSDSVEDRIVDIRTRRPWRPPMDRSAAIFGIQALVASVAVLLGAYFFDRMVNCGG
jgi:hypothetical protein